MFRNTGKKEDYLEKFRYENELFRIEWDKQPIMIPEYDESGNPTGEYHEDPVFVSWMQETYTYKPSLEEIKDMILSFYNKETDNKILTGFIWTPASGEPINVYLSTENQFDYKAAYDLAYQTNGASLPFTLKFGEIDNPKYYSFTTLEDFSNFIYSCFGFINRTLQEGWVKKDSIDWTKYDFSEPE